MGVMAETLHSAVTWLSVGLPPSMGCVPQPDPLSLLTSSVSLVKAPAGTPALAEPTFTGGLGRQPGDWARGKRGKKGEERPKREAETPRETERDTHLLRKPQWDRDSQRPGERGERG